MRYPILFIKSLTLSQTDTTIYDSFTISGWPEGTSGDILLNPQSISDDNNIRIKTFSATDTSILITYNDLINNSDYDPETYYYITTYNYDNQQYVFQSTSYPVLFKQVTKTFNIQNSGSGAYVIDGVSNGDIVLVRGNTYNFVINASGHPFWIQTVSGSYSNNNIYNSGITNNGTQNGTITFTVPTDAPNTLYYACQYHSSMKGTIIIN
jgi:hypothetical protein